MSCLIAASLFAVQASAAYAAPDYGQPGNWLCLPGHEPISARRRWRPLPSTPMAMGRPASRRWPRMPTIDCFYVYPTMSRDAGMNSDLNPGGGEEKAAIVSQFARFAGCLPDLCADLPVR